MDSNSVIFDRGHFKKVRARAASLIGSADFLLRRSAEDVAARLAATNKSFARALIIGDPGYLVEGGLARLGKTIGQEFVIHCDLCPAILPPGPSGKRMRLVLDEEALPLAHASLDLIVSLLTFHAINDLPGTLVQMRRALKPDGLLIASLFGGDTLNELRQSFLTAELATGSGASPHISPQIDIRDLGHLLQRAGFNMPVTDADKVAVTYRTPLELMRDLRAMGQTNILAARRKAALAKAVLAAMAETYADDFGGEDGRVTATFEILYATGWAPDAGQPRPLRPGSATHRLANALKTTEIELPPEEV